MKRAFIDLKMGLTSGKTEHLCLSVEYHSHDALSGARIVCIFCDAVHHFPSSNAHCTLVCIMKSASVEMSRSFYFNQDFMFDVDASLPIFRRTVKSPAKK